MNANIADLTPKARRTRLALLDAAKVELGDRGVAGMSVMSVCEKAGVGRTSFYNYFEDSDSLVAVVAQEAAKDIKARFDRRHVEFPRGQDRLKACLGMILETAVDDPETILLVVSLSNTAPEIMELLHAEILAELSAFAPGTEEDQLVMVQHLAQTALALARQLAIGNLARHNIDRHVELMMRVCS